MSLSLKTRIVLIAGGWMLFSAGSFITISGYLCTHECTTPLESRSLAIATVLKMQLERVLKPGIPLDNLIAIEEQIQEACDLPRRPDAQGKASETADLDLFLKRECVSGTISTPN